jgi:hypothetical protein
MQLFLLFLCFYPYFYGVINNIFIFFLIYTLIIQGSIQLFFILYIRIISNLIKNLTLLSPVWQAEIQANHITINLQLKKII